jgi:RNA 2',3'-cyclic 3'-phosphodiesterase
MRAFVAISVPKKQRDKIHRATRLVREQDYPVRWVEPERFHLTLKFLGQVRKEALPAVEGVLQRVAGTTGWFTMGFSGFGAFPTLRRPRVLWVGVDPSPALRCLKQDLEWTLSELGFERETRAFHPHLTLGRAPGDAGPGAFRGLDLLAAGIQFKGEVKVWKMDLMESFLSSSGPRYEIVSSFPLKGPQGRVEEP